jgi:hypothetical protein
MSRVARLSLCLDVELIEDADYRINTDGRLEFCFVH